MGKYVLPNLFIPGAAKSGTSSLHNLLNQHPDIYMSKIKEPHFFSWDEEFNKGIEHYSKLFEEGKNFKYRGESTTGYMIFPKVIDRIKETIKEEAKFIFILRNPIDRAYSHYWWLKGIGLENRTFKEAFLQNKEEEPNPENKYSGNYKYYYQSGLYAKWLTRYYKNFPKENIFIITTENLKEKPVETLNKCFQFLGLKELENISIEKENQTVIMDEKDAKIYGKLAIYLRDRNRAVGLRRFFRAIFPDSLRGRIFKKLNENLEEFREKKAKRINYPQLSKEDREFIKKFYIEDFEKLKKITGQKFLEWKDFYE